MRQRHIKGLEQKLEALRQHMVSDPAAQRGRWAPEQDVFIELGCGKGKFLTQKATSDTHAVYIGVEGNENVILRAVEKLDQAGLQNLRFVASYVENILDWFAPEELSGIYLNFSDPWPKNRDAKHRLTSPGFLELYESVLKPEGEIHFKTDNKPLFEYSVETFASEGWTLSEVTRNLHENGIVGVMTDYEAKFYEQGITINRLVAKKERH